jgi:crotonobetainyl-CoA:carnitine CoA-transferase CaiB-like acyl-CoA transferase
MLATAAGSGNAANLPLAGIKVLDMTRVLAGVCGRALFWVLHY